MAIQTSYPGVYIQEYEPAAPITGVSTSVTAFIGIAQSGPIGEPQLVTSLDAFTTKFGGPVLGAVPYYLPLAVTGFFANGGLYAYVTRVSTAVAAHADLAARTGAPAPTLAVIAAIRDGAAGAGGSATVEDSTNFATAIGATTLAAHKAPDATVSALDATRRILTVSDSTGFASGDTVVLKKGAGTSARLTISSVAATTVQLQSTAPAAPGAGDWNKVSTADLATGDQSLRVDVPSGVSLRAIIPSGSVIVIDDTANTAWTTVLTVGADSLTLAAPLDSSFDLSKTTIATAEFDLTITDPQNIKRKYGGLSTSPLHPRWWGSAVDDPYARVVIDSSAFPVGDPRPAAIAAVALAGETNDDAAAAWLKVATEIESSLKLLEPIDEISLVTVPGLTDLNAQRSIVEHCERMFDRFAILDAPRGIELDSVVTHREGLTGTLDKGFAALYTPWLSIIDPLTKRIVLQPPSGHIAGIYAKTDATEGVYKAPANVGIAGAVGLERRLTDTDQGFINPKGVNALRILPHNGSPIVWGARTTANDTNWQYVNIRRLFLYLEESIQEGINGSVFQPNDLALWQRLKRTLTEFLTGLWREGALFGETAKDAFFVRIDDVLNPESTRKLGQLFIEIGVQPVYPAEFIVVRIGIWDGGAEVSES